MTVRAIPEGYHSVTPFLVVKDAEAVLDFVRKAFDAQIVGQILRHPDGGIGHVEFKIGDSMIMMGEAQEEMDFNPMPCMLYVYVADADLTYRAALQAGGKSLREPANQFYGDRNAGVMDPAGNIWYIGTHIEDLTMEEIRKRMEEAQDKGKSVG